MNNSPGGIPGLLCVWFTLADDSHKWIVLFATAEYNAEEVKTSREGGRHSWINKMPENCHRERVILESIRQTCLSVSQTAEDSINIYSADGVSPGLKGTPICFDGGAAG